MVDRSLLISLGSAGRPNTRLEETHGKSILSPGGEKNDFLVLAVIKTIADGTSRWTRPSEVGRFVQRQSSDGTMEVRA